MKRSRSVLSVAGTGEEVRGAGPGLGAGLGPCRRRAPSSDGGCSLSGREESSPCASVCSFDSITFLPPGLRGPPQPRSWRQGLSRGFRSQERIVGGAAGEVLRVSDVRGGHRH